MGAVSQNFDEISRDIDKENARRPRAERDRHAELLAGYALRADFGVALGEEHAAHLPVATRDLIFDKAWSDGHSSGYHEVESHYEDLVEFVDKVRSH